MGKCLLQRIKEAAAHRPAVLRATRDLYASSLFRSSIKMVNNEWFWTTAGPPFISGPSSSSPWKKTSKHILGDPASHCSMLTAIFWLIF